MNHEPIIKEEEPQDYNVHTEQGIYCLLYTSDAADE